MISITMWSSPSNVSIAAVQFLASSRSFVHEGRLGLSQGCNEECLEPKVSSKLLGSFNFYPSDDVVPVLGLGQRVDS